MAKDEGRKKISDVFLCLLVVGRIVLYQYSASKYVVVLPVVPVVYFRLQFHCGTLCPPPARLAKDDVDQTIFNLSVFLSLSAFVFVYALAGDVATYRVRTRR